MVRFRRDNEVGRRRRRKEAEILKDEWKDLSYFKGMKYEPLLEDFGSTCDGACRQSKRIYWKRLLTH